jgi:hypothetical protein
MDRRGLICPIRTDLHSLARIFFDCFVSGLIRSLFSAFLLHSHSLLTTHFNAFSSSSFSFSSFPSEDVLLALGGRAGARFRCAVRNGVLPNYFRLKNLMEVPKIINHSLFALKVKRTQHQRLNTWSSIGFGFKKRVLLVLLGQFPHDNRFLLNIFDYFWSFWDRYHASIDDWDLFDSMLSLPFSRYNFFLFLQTSSSFFQLLLLRT